MLRVSHKERGQRKDPEDQRQSFGRYPCPHHNGPRRAPRGKHKSEPALKKAHHTSVGAPLVLESGATDESDIDESDTEVGGIASRVRHNRPYYQHVSHGQERAQREREKEQALDTINKGVSGTERFLST